MGQTESVETSNLTLDLVLGQIKKVTNYQRDNLIKQQLTQLQDALVTENQDPAKIQGLINSIKKLNDQNLRSKNLLYAMMNPKI